MLRLLGAILEVCVRLLGNTHKKPSQNFIMKTQSPMLLAAALVSMASLYWTSQSLNSTCTPSYISSLVSAFGDLDAVTYHLDNITTAIVTNYTATPSLMGPMFPTALSLNFAT